MLSLNSISLDNMLPKVFVGQEPCGDSSDIWLHQVKFSRGETILLQAESGRGKTSLCSYMAQLRSDYVGQLHYLDEQGTELCIEPSELLRQHIGVMFQEHRLFADLTAVENVMLKNQLTQYTTEHEVRQQLSRLGLADRMDCPCSMLSLGQQQRVAFVRALCQPCSFLLLDEPVSHLDPANAAVMAEMVRERQVADDLCLIVTSVGHHLPSDFSQIYKL